VSDEFDPQKSAVENLIGWCMRYYRATVPGGSRTMQSRMNIGNLRMEMAARVGDAQQEMRLTAALIEFHEAYVDREAKKRAATMASNVHGFRSDEYTRAVHEFTAAGDRLDAALKALS
jgi:hypothetical protein